MKRTRERIPGSKNNNLGEKFDVEPLLDPGNGNTEIVHCWQNEDCLKFGGFNLYRALLSGLQRLAASSPVIQIIPVQIKFV